MCRNRSRFAPDWRPEPRSADHHVAEPPPLEADPGAGIAVILGHLEQVTHPARFAAERPPAVQVQEDQMDPSSVEH